MKYYFLLVLCITTKLTSMERQVSSQELSQLIELFYRGNEHQRNLLYYAIAWAHNKIKDLPYKIMQSLRTLQILTQVDGTLIMLPLIQNILTQEYTVDIEKQTVEKKS